jgi:hypothetical protein
MGAVLNRMTPHRPYDPRSWAFLYRSRAASRARVRPPRTVKA